MREELTIALSTSEVKKEELQCKIYNMFEYNGWPSDEAFLSLGPILDDIKIEQAKIDVLKGTIECINSNDATP